MNKAENLGRQSAKTACQLDAIFCHFWGVADFSDY